MVNTRYPEGFLPKIAYHMFKNNFDKMLYFYDRQIEKYGEMTNAQKERVTELHNELVMDQAVQEAQDHFITDFSIREEKGDRYTIGYLKATLKYIKSLAKDA